MDMRKPFENVARVHIPTAAILYDKFHIIARLGKALDTVRKNEYARLSGTKRRFMKGQKYHLLSHRKNLTLSGKKPLKTLLEANKRLNAAYVHKESFGQLWDYSSEAWARKFFDNWKASLRWQRLKPYEGVCPAHRATLGRHGCLLQTGEQSLSRLCRRIEQQNSRHSTSYIWSAR